MLPRVRHTLTRELPHAPGAVYSWCTDYSGEDAQLSGGYITGRRVLEKTPGRVRLETRVRVAGKDVIRTHEVRLDPAANRWEVRIAAGPATGSHHVYQAVARPGGGTRLVIRFGYTAPTLREQVDLWRKRKHVRQGLETMWDSFVAAMAKDLPS